MGVSHVGQGSPKVADIRDETVDRIANDGGVEEIGFFEEIADVVRRVQMNQCGFVPQQFLPLRQNVIHVFGRTVILAHLMKQVDDGNLGTGGAGRQGVPDRGAAGARNVIKDQMPSIVAQRREPAQHVIALPQGFVAFAHGVVTLINNTIKLPLQTLVVARPD